MGRITYESYAQYLGVTRPFDALTPQARALWEQMGAEIQRRMGERAAPKGEAA